jgi:phenylpropionate dioxygenase-like ring-hydroxylating dioxygenase large terminal subunit
VKQVHILGRDLAVFRTETGKVGCTDAYCPHLGANLAAGRWAMYRGMSTTNVPRLFYSVVLFSSFCFCRPTIRLSIRPTFDSGGTVCGERLQCPFHGWEFNTEGKCEKIPYSQSKIPEQAKVDAYNTLEINDQILFW